MAWWPRSACSAWIVLGTLTPADVLVQGAVFALVAIGWMVVRAARHRAPLQNGAGRATRAVTTAGPPRGGDCRRVPRRASPAGGRRPRRTVLRTALTPPYDVTQFPSPLAGFRQYTEPNPAELFDKTLLTVKGLPRVCRCASPPSTLRLLRLGRRQPGQPR